MTRKDRPMPSRSPKAGRPPKTIASTPRVKRREKTAHAAVSKGTTLKETAVGPRAAWSGAKPMWKKR